MILARTLETGQTGQTEFYNTTKTVKSTYLYLRKVCARYRTHSVCPVCPVYPVIPVYPFRLIRVRARAKFAQFYQFFKGQKND